MKGDAGAAGASGSAPQGAPRPERRRRLNEGAAQGSARTSTAAERRSRPVYRTSGRYRPSPTTTRNDARPSPWGPTPGRAPEIGRSLSREWRLSPNPADGPSGTAAPSATGSDENETRG